MSSNRIIAVTGATGAQGGGLVRAILATPSAGFTVRAITRNPGSDKAQALAALGAEVVAADLDDRESLQRAFAGAFGAYCVTNFWEHFSPEKELQQAGNLAAAARDSGLQHVIWSTLEDTRDKVPLSDPSMPTLGGHYKVPHFDAKGEADRLFREADVPTTFLRTSFYWENFIHFGMGPRRGDDGSLVLSLPMADKRLAGIAVEDIGKAALGLFRQGRATIGRTVGIAGEHLTGEAIAAAMAQALGQPVRYAPMSFDAYRALGFPGADDLGNMFQFYCDFEADVLAARPLDATRALNPELQSLERWLAANASRMPLD